MYLSRRYLIFNNCYSQTCTVVLGGLSLMRTHTYRYFRVLEYVLQYSSTYTCTHCGEGVFTWSITGFCGTQLYAYRKCPICIILARVTRCFLFYFGAIVFCFAGAGGSYAHLSSHCNYQKHKIHCVARERIIQRAISYGRTPGCYGIH